MAKYVDQVVPILIGFGDAVSAFRAFGLGKARGVIISFCTAERQHAATDDKEADDAYLMFTQQEEV